MAFTPIVLGSLAWGTPVNNALASQDARIAAIEAQGGATLDAQGIVAAPFDPAAAASGTVFTSGTVYMTRVDIVNPATLAGLVFTISTAGAGLTAGQNLVAAWPPPLNASPAYPVTLDVVCNAPVPSSASDILQISADVYDSILDYAQHLALFKQGPGELQLAMGLLERAGRAAGVELQLQQASQPSRTPLLRQQAQDGDAVLREQESIPV